jgi:hypothetical protein
MKRCLKESGDEARGRHWPHMHEALGSTPRTAKIIIKIK